MAWIVVSIVPWAVITTIDAVGRSSRILPSAVRPSMPGIRTSRRTRSNGSASTARTAAAPSFTAVTS